VERLGVAVDAHRIGPDRFHRAPGAIKEQGVWKLSPKIGNGPVETARPPLTNWLILMGIFGEPGGIRTHDPMIKSHVLAAFGGF
jgi:hypothetical protein